jgi:hypothetical protein
MERQSTTHSPRIDDEMKHETRSMTAGAPVESRANEQRMMEAPADGEPFPDARVRDGDDPRADDEVLLGRDEVEARSELASYLRPSAFPASGPELLAIADDENAPSWVLDFLGRLPGDRSYETFGEVWTALGGNREERVHSAPPAPSGDPLLVQVAHTGVGIAMRVTRTAVNIGLAAFDRVGRWLRRG